MGRGNVLRLGEFVYNELMSNYDSIPDTLAHIEQVRFFLGITINIFLKRAFLHDKSKLEEPEKSLFDKYTPLLRDTTYGSDEYKQHLSEMGTALQHHYAVNNHHPEHYEKGVNGMSLFDLLEMFTDWYAASKRHADGSMIKSLEYNRGHFVMSDQLFEIFMNTYHEINLHDF